MLLAVVLSALCSASALAGSFQLVSGKRFDLCRGYDKNLRSFRDPAVSDDFRSSSGEGRLYDSFFFRGRFYLIGWFGGGLAIFEPQAVPEESGILVRPVCSFRYLGEW
jgi:hypothetical protein